MNWICIKYANVGVHIYSSTFIYSKKCYIWDSLLFASQCKDYITPYLESFFMKIWLRTILCYVVINYI